MRKAEFVEVIRAQCEKSRALLDVRTRLAPRHVFLETNHSASLPHFYREVDQWDRWRSGLISLLTRHLQHPDHHVEDAQRRFATSNLLRFSIREFNNHELVRTFDLTDRVRYNDPAGWMEVRTAFERGLQPEPMWNMALHNMQCAVNDFCDMLAEYVDDLDLFAEKEAPMPGPVTINIHAPLSQSPILVGNGRQSVSFGMVRQPTAEVFDALTRELADLSEQIRTIEDLQVGARRSAIEEWESLRAAIASVITHMHDNAKRHADWSPDELRGLAEQTVMELNLAGEIKTNLAKHPIVQSLTASGIAALIGYIASLIGSR